MVPTMGEGADWEGEEVILKIVKLIKNRGHYYVMFDVIPEITYEKVGSDYVGSSVDSDGTIIASNFLKYEKFGDAFAGREIKLSMKDGSIQAIKDHWFDHGWYREHGDFMGIGAGTLAGLQRCYVYFSYNINKEEFNKMIEEYLSRDRLYEYREIEEWCKLQYKWYPVIVNNQHIPYMMNEYGDMVEKETKKRVFPRENRMKKVKGNYRTYTYFRFKYKDGDRHVRIDANYLETLKTTLPFSEEEIRIKCKL